MDKRDASYNNNWRRWFHFLTIAALALTYGLTSYSWNVVMPVLGIIAASFITLDLIRLEVPALNQFVQNRFSFILRKHEFHSISGSSWFLLGALINVALFPKLISVLGFLYLAVGDPLAAYCGIKWGGKQVGKKTWAGGFGFLLSCWLVGSLWLFSQDTPPYAAMAAAGISALVASVTESVLHEMDDNLIIPLVSSTVAFVVLL